MSAWGLTVLGGLLAASPSEPSRVPGPPPPVVEHLLVTEGQPLPLVGGGLRVDEPKVRAVAASRAGLEALAWVPPSPGPRVAELRFTYRGPSTRQEPLRSGETRRQVGLKLRARDGCNVVYVMWRLAPVPGLVVSVKSNPAQHRSVDCGNGGYDTVRAAHASPVPTPAPGEAHTLRAWLDGARLQVHADGRPVWEGELPAEALAFDGPAGLRTDNGRFDLELRSLP